MSKIDTSRKQELCLQCQECCKVLGVPSPFPIDYAAGREFYERRGCKVVNVEGRLVVAVESRCPELTSFGCRSYDNRPEWCRLYDGRKDAILRDKCLWGKEK